MDIHRQLSVKLLQKLYISTKPEWFLTHVPSWIPRCCAVTSRSLCSFGALRHTCVTCPQVCTRGKIRSLHHDWDKKKCCLATVRFLDHYTEDGSTSLRRETREKRRSHE
jgi:hypothetical protein